MVSCQWSVDDPHRPLTTDQRKTGSKTTIYGWYCTTYLTLERDNLRKHIPLSIHKASSTTISHQTKSRFNCQLSVVSGWPSPSTDHWPTNTDHRPTGPTYDHHLWLILHSLLDNIRKHIPLSIKKASSTTISHQTKSRFNSLLSIKKP